MLNILLQFALAVLPSPLDMSPFKPAPAFTQVEISWDNGSVPPPYHREHRITVSKEGGRATVHDYSEQLSSTDFPVTDAQFTHLQDVVRTAKIRVGKNRPAGGCAGGSPLHLALSKDGETVLTGELYRCGGKDYGDLYGDVDAVQTALQELVPPSAESEG